MAVLAAPLVIPFAEALGLSVATLGIAKASDMVNEYIQENPEQSMKIFQMIMPAQGIANALKNKSSEDVEEVQESEIFMNKEKISLEDLDEMTDEEAADLPDEDKTELMKQAGKRKDRELSIATSEKLGLSGPGKEKIDIEREIDERVDPGGIQKEKKGYDFRDYIPKGAYKKRYADGGSIGIEILFEPKRKDFNIGGNVQRVTTPQPYDPRASATDFARAIDMVGAGTNMQKAKAIQSYDQNVQRQNMVNRIQKMNPAGTGNFLQGIKDFGDHARVSETMAGKLNKPVIPEYGFQTGYDFQKKFTGLDPKISAGLAAAYQTLQEGSRALLDGPGGITLGQAMKTAQQQATENMEGIFAADTGTITPEQQAARNEYLESQGQPTEPVIDQDRISEIVEQQKAAGVPETGLITNFQQDDGSSVIPNFEKLTDGTYKDTRSGDIYGAETYASIAAGMYPNIYDPNKQTLADGGRVGLFMGGDPLTGQALAIYNSMNSYGFTDQQIADALQGQGLYTPGGTTPDAPTTIQPIGFQSNNEGGGGITELTPLNTKKNISSGINRNDKTFIDPLNEKIANQMITQNPNLNKYTTEEIVSMNPDIFDIKTDKGFIGNTIDNFKTMGGNLIDKFSGSKVGESATKFKNFAITPMMALMNKRNPLNPDAMNYNPNLQKQMDFLEGQTGTKITGTSGNLKFTDDQMMIGRDPNSGLAKYGPGSVLEGQNVVSGFGTNDYEEQLGKYIEKMRNRAITKNLSKFQQAKLDAAIAEMGREMERQQREVAERARAANPDVYARADELGFTDGKGGGFASKSTGTNEAFSNKTGRGRTGYSEGGLATMFKEKR